MTLTVHNLHEIPMFLAQYRTLGFDVINFGYDRETVPTYLHENREFKETLSQKTMESLVDARMEDIDLKRLKQLDLVRGIDGAIVERRG
jgi:hypothetical protein